MTSAVHVPTAVIDADGRLSIGKFPSVADDRSVTKGEILAGSQVSNTAASLGLTT